MTTNYNLPFPSVVPPWVLLRAAAFAALKWTCENDHRCAHHYFDCAGFG